MSIIDRYLGRTFLSGYLILMLVGVGLYVLTDVLLNADEFTKDESLPLLQVLGLMGDYYLCNLPLYYSQLGGPLMAIAAATPTAPSLVSPSGAVAEVPACELPKPNWAIDS